ncbi:MAG TPA: nuclear transport factor 2 family protein [Actinocrinis sp.]|jgi:hypothetical protein
MSVTEDLASLSAARPAGYASLADLLDRAEINDLISRMNACLDEHRFDELSSLYVEDATIDTPGGGLITGRDGVVAEATRSHGVFERLQHTTTNVLIDLDGDRAEARANMIAGMARNGLQPDAILGGVNTYKVVRTPEGWRFASVVVRPIWRDDRKAAAAAAQPTAG